MNHHPMMLLHRSKGSSSLTVNSSQPWICADPVMLYVMLPVIWLVISLVFKSHKV